MSAVWTRIAQAIHRFHWFHPSEPKTDSGSSTTRSNDNPSISSDPRTDSGSSAARSNHNSSISSDEESPPKPNDISSSGPLNSNSAGPDRENLTDDDNASDSDDEDHKPTINDTQSLKKGTINTLKNKANAPYNILIVGETGVGKSSMVELIANVLFGNDIENCDLNILDLANEQGGSHNQSQTNLARLYEFKSKNGIVVRILDTPGLADTRGPQQDELHQKSIATQIEKYIDCVTAVVILANGTVPRVTVGTDYALSTLSAIFPNSLAKNIAFIFTNVLSPLHWNFSDETLPDALKNAPQFFINNPIALQKKYLKLKDRPNTKKGGADLRSAVKTAEQDALVTLVGLFDWLDSLEAQQTTQIAEKLHKIADARAPVDQPDARNNTDMNKILSFCRRVTRSRRRLKPAGR